MTPGATVRYRISGALREVLLGRCEQSRRTAAHYVAATLARRADSWFEPADGLCGYASATGVRRGLCETCGSSPFREPAKVDTIGIMASTLDGPTGLRVVGRIHAAAADYYSIDPAVPVQAPPQQHDSATAAHSTTDPKEQR